MAVHCLFSLFLREIVLFYLSAQFESSTCALGGWHIYLKHPLPGAGFFLTLDNNSICLTVFITDSQNR